MIFTFHNTTEWWRYVGSRLAFAGETVVVSDLPDADVDINPAFHRYMRVAGIEEEALDAFGQEGCGDVILRCRLLRVLDRDVALRMIGAMWRTIQELLDRERPDVFLAFVVDRYILDLFERALARRGVRYVGIAIGVLPETCMFMARGEYLPVREPSDGEVETAVTAMAQPQFVPSYVSGRRFGLVPFLSLYLRFTVRWLLFEAARVLRRLPYDYRYLTARSSASGFRVRLRDWGVMRFFRNGWRQALAATPFERRVFLALSVNPEAAIEYWLRNPGMIDYNVVLERLVNALDAGGFHIFVKDHPNQFGFRQVELFSALARHPAVSFVPYDVPGHWLIDRCRTTFTWTGTVGLQAAMAGRCAVVDASAYYFVEGLFVGVKDVADLDETPRKIEAFASSMPLSEARRIIARRLLRSSVPGDYTSWRGFTTNDPNGMRKADTLLNSLNIYVPILAKGSAE
jgi:hypothetical protein